LSTASSHLLLDVKVRKALPWEFVLMVTGLESPAVLLSYRRSAKFELVQVLAVAHHF
jgi:hypothetical protein